VDLRGDKNDSYSDDTQPLVSFKRGRRPQLPSTTASRGAHPCKKKNGRKRPVGRRERSFSQRGDEGKRRVQTSNETGSLIATPPINEENERKGLYREGKNQSPKGRLVSCRQEIRSYVRKDHLKKREVTSIKILRD